MPVENSSCFSVAFKMWKQFMKSKRQISGWTSALIKDSACNKFLEAKKHSLDLSNPLWMTLYVEFNQRQAFCLWIIIPCNFFAEASAHLLLFWLTGAPADGELAEPTHTHIHIQRQGSRNKGYLVKKALFILHKKSFKAAVSFKNRLLFGAFLILWVILYPP